MIPGFFTVMQGTSLNAELRDDTLVIYDLESIRHVTIAYVIISP